jgi:LysM repeat protein
MLRLSISRPAVAVGAASLLIVAAGCTTASPQRDLAAVAPYGAESLYNNDYVDDERPAWGEMAAGSRLAARMEGQAMTVAFRGFAGARLAHELYGEVEAEKYDGNCGPYAKIENGETAHDIAEYCDVTVDTLLAANPGLYDARAVYDGQTIAVPTAYAGLANTHWANVAYSVYVIQAGDTIESIAYTHRVSPTTLIALNPNVDWRMPPAGVELRVPAVAGAQAVPQAAPRTYIAPSEQSSPDAYDVSPEVESLMPYKLTPAQEAAQAKVSAPPLLTVDRQSVNPGESVTVSAVGLPPYADVEIYRGPNGRKLEHVTTVRTDAEGRISESIRVKKSSDLGGVIFKATVAGQDYQSPRVGVNKLGSDDEEEEEDLEDLQ